MTVTPMSERALRRISSFLAKGRPDYAKAEADKALRGIERRKAAWGRQKCECACAHKRRDPCIGPPKCLLPCGMGY